MPITKILELSYKHLPDRVANEIIYEPTTTAITDGEDGDPVFVYVPQGSHFDHKMSTPLFDVLHYAWKHNCKWVLFNRDGPINPDLRTYLE